MKSRLVLLGLALIGWAICGATIGVGRQLVSLRTTLIVHAVVAPLSFALLTWLYFRLFPSSSSLRVAFTMLAVVIGMDALLVAPFLERSYAMFTSVLGTWLPFASIFAASLLVGHAARR